MDAQRIDVHQHLLPDFYLSALENRGLSNRGGRPFPEWDTQSTLELMERHGIATAMLSLSEPGVYFGDAQFARDLARRCNEYAAQLIQKHPGRFGAFAFLPLPDVEGALNELAYALDVLKLDGVILLSNYNGHYPGDPLFDELFDELQRRQTVVFLHPTVPTYYDSLKLSLPAFMLEFVFDTTRAATNLLFSGTLDRCPGVRFILAHAVGTIPYLTTRIAAGSAFIPGAPQGVIGYLQQFYYDTALSSSPYTLRTLSELVDASHILFGSDYPFAPEFTTMFTVRGIQTFDGFDEQKRALIERENMLSLFPRLQEKRL